MAKHSPQDEEKGRTLLSAVERLVASNETIRRKVAEALAGARSLEGEGAKKSAIRERAAAELTSSSSNRAAVAGAAAGAPALIPGLGSLAAAVAGTFVELAYLLKTEVELSLALSHLYGFDIDDPRERQLAFLMASVGTYDATGKNFFADVARVEGEAVWNYGPRRLTSFVLSAMTSVALVYVWRGFLRVVPVVGMVIGGTMNKVLTSRVGARVARDVKTRRELLRDEVKPRAQKPKGPAKAKAEKRRKPKLSVVPPKSSAS